MFLLGHLGIGERIGRPFTAPSARAALFLGTVLPDLVDKPLYYGLVLATGKHGSELGLIAGTRTFGHSLLFAIVCYAVCRFVFGRSNARALFVGLITHFILDLGGELWGSIAVSLALAPAGPSGPNIFSAFFFPLLGPHFPIAPFHTAIEHLATLKSGYTLLGELIGGTLLLLDWRAWKKSREKKI